MMNLREYRDRNRQSRRLPALGALVGEGVVLNKDGSVPAHGALSRSRSRQSTPAELVAVAGRLNNALRRLGSGWAIFVEAQRRPGASLSASTLSRSCVGAGRQGTPRTVSRKARISKAAIS
jgi:type IV secretory pathway VirB4 component